MPAPEDKGEATVTINGVDLAVQFKTRNLRVLSDLTGKSPFEFFSVFQGLDESPGALMKILDPNLAVPLLVAGIAHHPQFRKLSAARAEERIETYIDLEAMKRGVDVFTICTELLTLLLPVAVGSLPRGEDGQEAEEGNVEASVVEVPLPEQG